MTIVTIVGPLKNKSEAVETAASLGNQCSVYSRAIKDSEGYDTDDSLWYVERDDSITPDKLFGYDAKEFLSRQYNKGTKCTT